MMERTDKLYPVPLGSEVGPEMYLGSTDGAQNFLGNLCRMPPKVVDVVTQGLRWSQTIPHPENGILSYQSKKGFLCRVAQQATQYETGTWTEIVVKVLPDLEKILRWSGEAHDKPVEQLGKPSEYGFSGVGLIEDDAFHSLAVATWGVHIFEGIMMNAPDLQNKHEHVRSLVARLALFHDVAEIKAEKGDISLLSLEHSKRKSIQEATGGLEYVAGIEIEEADKQQLRLLLTIFEDQMENPPKDLQLAAQIVRFADRVAGGITYLRWSSAFLSTLMGASEEMREDPRFSTIGYSWDTVGNTFSRVGKSYDAMVVSLKQLGYPEDSLTNFESFWNAEYINLMRSAMADREIRSARSSFDPSD